MDRRALAGRVVGYVALRASSVPGLAVEKLSDPIGQGVKAEVGDAEDALRGPQDMAGRHAKLHPEAQAHGGKIGGCRHQHHQGLKPPIGQAANIFQLITLFEEPNNVPDASAGDAGGDHMPERLATAPHRKVG